MTLETFPVSNLPKDSLAWRRVLEKSISGTSRQIDIVQENINSDNRALSGQFTATGRSLDSTFAAATELGARQSFETTVSALTTTRTTPALNTEYAYSASTTVSVPLTSDGVRRKGVMFASFGATNSHPSITSGRVYFNIRQLTTGLDRYSVSTANPAVASVPPGWTEAGFISGAFTGGTPSTQVFTLRMSGFVSRYSGSATTLTVGVNNIRILFIYGEPV